MTILVTCFITSMAEAQSITNARNDILSGVVATAAVPIRINAALTTATTTATTTPLGREATTGDPVYLNEEVITGAQYGAEILLKDQSTLTLGPNANLVIDRFVYDPGAENSMLVSIRKGGFKFVSGKIAASAPDAMQIILPNATASIRGTSGVGRVAADGSVALALLSGEISLDDESGSSVSLIRPGWGVVISAEGVVSPPAPVDEAALNNLIEAVALNAKDDEQETDKSKDGAEDKAEEEADDTAENKTDDTAENKTGDEAENKTGDEAENKTGDEPENKTDDKTENGDENTPQNAANNRADENTPEADETTPQITEAEIAIASASIADALKAPDGTSIKAEDIAALLLEDEALLANTGLDPESLNGGVPDGVSLDVGLLEYVLSGAVPHYMTLIDTGNGYAFGNVGGGADKGLYSEIYAGSVSWSGKGLHLTPNSDVASPGNGGRADYDMTLNYDTLTFSGQYRVYDIALGGRGYDDSGDIPIAADYPPSSQATTIYNQPNFDPEGKLDPNFPGQDANGNGLLDPGENLEFINLDQAAVSHKDGGASEAVIYLNGGFGSIAQGTRVADGVLAGITVEVVEIDTTDPANPTFTGESVSGTEYSLGDKN